jgi:group II intron reverse transcriptase/maturase
MEAGDTRRVRNLQRLILKSRSARLLAIRQVTQLNAGKKTAGVDGVICIKPEKRFALEETLRQNVLNWNHQGLREIPIPKKDGTKRILKVPTISDRAWQCLVKYALEPAHEATFHERSYGFRPGRSTHDCQKQIFNNLRSKSKGASKRILELDIEKCFDRIDHADLMRRVIAPTRIKTALWKCLKTGMSIEYPDQGTPQGGVVSPLLANIALNGIEDIHSSVRYADDMVFFIKPRESAERVLNKVSEFLAIRGLKVKASKTRIVWATDGFDFLGWHFKVQSNGKFRCTPSTENYEAFHKKVKAIVNSSNCGAKEKAQKLAPLVRGWRNYHRFCKMDGGRFSLWFLNNRAWDVFNKEKKLSRESVTKLIEKAFPTVPYSENNFVNVKGNKSPFDGDIVYWSERNSKLYDGATGKLLKKQNHTCGHCGLKFVGEEKVHLHHTDGNHNNWKPSNIMVIHESCHDYIHMGKRPIRKKEKS